MVPVTAAGLALAVYTKNIPFGFYMASIMLGSCSVVNHFSREIKNDIALNMQRASAPLVVPLRFPYRVLVTAAPDERSVEMRLEAIQPGALLTLQRVGDDGRIAINSREGPLGFLSERHANALAQIEVGYLFVRLDGVRRVGPKAFRLRVRIDTRYPDTFTG